MMQTNIDSPMVRQMVKQSPSLAKMVNTQTTAYYSGRRSRVDTARNQEVREGEREGADTLES